MKPLFKRMLSALLFLYPIAIYVALSYGRVKELTIILFCIGVARLFYGYSQESARLSALLTGVALILIACGVLIFQNPNLLKIYPVVVNVSFLFLFSSSLLSQVTIIERLASIREKNITEAKRQYMRKLTKVWSLFFLVNAMIALITALFCSLQLWTFYNGFLSYLLMGTLFLGELLYRKKSDAS